jgi:hypothetical protein
MNKTLISGLFLLLLLPSARLHSQEFVSNKSVTGVCYAGTRVNKIYVPPPKGFSDRAGAKGLADITVSYTGFSTEAKNAVEYAVNILESVLPADVKLNIKASWTKISTSGVLGNSSITGFAAGWGIDAFDPLAYYPVTVAEKIAGRSLNEDWEADVELVLNSNAKWYFGTDGNTPVTKYDLVTVVIHELCHGLGFFDSMNAENLEGSYGLGSMPVIYDKFVSNLTGSKLTDTTVFAQGSRLLYDALTGSQLYFDGPLTVKYLNGGRARLYAPSTWDPGSSVSHLDELRTSAADGLMTPFIDYGEAIHNPGKLTLSILGDVGWVNTRIIHDQLKDTEQPVSQARITAKIVSDTAFDKNSVRLYYSFNAFGTSDFISMTPDPGADTYSGTVQIPSYNTRMDYYFSVSDVFARLYRSPSRGEKSPFKFFIGIDTVKPVITHTPPEYFFEKIDTIHISTAVTDNLGIDTVYIEYRINSDPSKFIGMKHVEGDEYKSSLALRHENLAGGDVVDYRIIAVDKAAAANSRTFPSSGFSTIRIESLMPVVTSYTTDFTNASAEFFNSGFNITKPAGFTNFGLHSEHPYKSPDEDYKSLEFSSVLRHPVVFDPSGMIISFREVVLVEPGAEGSVFGFSDFYDYVILEASGDYGKTWFSLADGYDSRFLPSWETDYNSMIDGQNSTYQGDESMLFEHTFYPRRPDKISLRDTLLIRFRLFSDPYANGWGWAIEDLNITPLVDEVEEIQYSELRIFPNPGNGRIKIALPDRNSSDPVNIRVYNLTGRCVLNEAFVSGDLPELDISRYPAGFYIIVINDGSRVNSVKYNLVK